MSSRQERLARRRKLAEQQATQIVEEAVTRVVAARPSPSSPQEATPELVKDMRDNKGMTWMAIGKELGLSGAKFGAGQARKLYAAANNGTIPRKYAPRAGTTPRAEGPGRSGTKTDRKLMLVEQGHVIPRDLPDEEVEAMLVGRTIEWVIDMARLTETDPDTWGSGDGRWVKQDAKVHVDPQWVYVSTDEDTGERTVRFREYAGFDTDRHKHMSGPTRVVRVDAIHTIR